MSTEIDIPSHQFSFPSLACHAFSYTILYPNENWWEPMSISVADIEMSDSGSLLELFFSSKQAFQPRISPYI